MRPALPSRGPGRIRSRGGRRNLPVLFALAGLLLSCNLQEPPEEYFLDIRNPEVSRNLDSLLIFGIDPSGGDTLLILRWTKAEAFPGEVAYPAELGKDFVLLALGFNGGMLVRQSKTAITAGRPGPTAYERLLMAPDLADTLVGIPLRIGDSIVLAPIWKQRPGWQEKEFAPEGACAWRKGGRLLGADSLLELSAVDWDDSGTYVFRCENGAGRDSMAFRVSIRHRLPEIAEIPDRASLAGHPLSIQARIRHSDALQFKWMRGSVVVSLDSVLTIPEIKASLAHVYRLEVRNASDTSESAVSNDFRIHVVAREAKWDEMRWDGEVWW